MPDPSNVQSQFRWLCRQLTPHPKATLQRGAYNWNHLRLPITHLKLEGPIKFLETCDLGMWTCLQSSITFTRSTTRKGQVD
jgi:hypothetical protein